MEIYSIGFTQKNASEFFGPLKANGIERLLDVRLNNTSQLAGFAKQADLPYFLSESAALPTSTSHCLPPRRRCSMPSRSKKEAGTITPERIGSDPLAKGGIGSSPGEFRAEDRSAVQRSDAGALPPAAGARLFT